MPCKINNEEYIQDISNPWNKLDTDQKNGGKSIISYVKQWYAPDHYKIACSR